MKTIFDKIQQTQIEFQMKECRTKEEIISTYPIMSQLRPQLKQDQYFDQVNKIMKDEGYRLIAAYDNQKKCIGLIGFQKQNRLSLGCLFYIADLVVHQALRSKGVGAHLLDLVKKEAKEQKIDAIVLDSAIDKVDAHKFYQRHQYEIKSYSFRLFKPFDERIKEKNVSILNNQPKSAYTIRSSL